MGLDDQSDRPTLDTLDDPHPGASSDDDLRCVGVAAVVDVGLFDVGLVDVGLVDVGLAGEVQPAVCRTGKPCSRAMLMLSPSATCIVMSTIGAVLRPAQQAPNGGRPSSVRCSSASN